MKTLNALDAFLGWQEPPPAVRLRHLAVLVTWLDPIARWPPSLPRFGSGRCVGLSCFHLAIHFRDWLSSICNCVVSRIEKLLAG